MEHANKGLSELYVCNNQLTTKCLETLCRCRFRTLDLSHNSLGPTLFKLLPKFLEKIPSLKQLTLESTDIGKRLDIDDAVQTIYSNHARKGIVTEKSKKRKIRLNLSNTKKKKDLKEQIWHLTYQVIILMETC